MSQESGPLPGATADAVMDQLRETFTGFQVYMNDAELLKFSLGAKRRNTVYAMLDTKIRLDVAENEFEALCAEGSPKGKAEAVKYAERVNALQEEVNRYTKQLESQGATLLAILHLERANYIDDFIEKHYEGIDIASTAPQARPQEGVPAEAKPTTKSASGPKGDSPAESK